jgi:glycosyltransferase involved in cell wall biosynthesis
MMSRAKVFLHVCLSESWGGLEMAVSRWNAILSEQGHQNINICTPDSPLSQSLLESGHEMVAWDSAPYFSPDFTWKLRKLIMERNVDCVILQNLRELWLVSPALWGLNNVKFLGFTQMLVGVKKKDPLHRLIYSRLDRVLTLTDWQQGALLSYLPIPKHKYQTIPNFVDCEHFHPRLRSKSYRYNLGYNEEDFLIGLIGRIDQQKGQQELLQSFAQVSSQFPRAKVLIVGEPTLGEVAQEEYFKQIKNFVRQQNLEKKVRFFGFQKEPHKVFANLDLFVLPSYRETFGFVVVEAMASGVAVLGTRAGGVPEILGQGEYGFLCPPQDPNGMAEELTKILSDGKLRQQKSTSALQRARSFYAREKVYERFMDLLDE